MSLTHWFESFRGHKPSRRCNKTARPRRRSPAQRIEELEQRLCLDGVGLNSLAFLSESLAAGDTRVIDFPVAAEQFTLPAYKDSVTIGVSLSSGGASTFDVLDSAGNPVPRHYRPPQQTLEGVDVVLAELAHGDYRIVVDGVEDGEFDLNVYLVGDIDGDRDVDVDDATAMAASMRQGDAGSNLAADIDYSGSITGLDFSFLRRNLGAATTAVLPFSVAVDKSLRPDAEQYFDYDSTDPVKRTVSRLVDQTGQAVDFVDNELLLMSNDDGEVQAFLDRWDGEILQKFKPGEHGFENAKDVYLIRVKTDTADVEKLEQNLKQIDPNSRGTLKVSSERGEKLLAAAAEEGAKKLEVGINFIGKAQSYLDNVSNEAPSADSSITGYVNNAFQWSHLQSGGPIDTGVTDAWRVLEFADKLDNEVDYAVLDMGFINDADTAPDARVISIVPGVSPYTSSYDSAKPWHGALVESSAMALADNNFGSAGVAGDFTDPLLLYTPYDIFSGIAAVYVAAGEGAEIINMSYQMSVPAALSFSVLPFDVATLSVRNSGSLLFAAAGNDGINVDETDCFLVCWEETWHAPAENDGVIGVGGVGVDGSGNLIRHPNSNYGDGARGDVDIYAPYTVFVGEDPGTLGNYAQQVSGTSFASPFAAGVAAMIWAADPSLSADQVEEILIRTAKHSPAPGVHRLVDALAAVQDVVGDTPPVVQITGPTQTTFFGGVNVPLRAFADDFDGPVNVAWTSNLDGEIGAGTSINPHDLSYGTHVITATATDGIGQTDTDTITIDIVNDAPEVSILSPQPMDELLLDADQTFVAHTFDLETGGELPPSAVSWQIQRVGTTFMRMLGQGNPLSPTFSSLLFDEGDYELTATATDSQGATAQATVRISLVKAVGEAPVVHITSPTDADVIDLNADHFDADLGLFYANVTFDGFATDDTSIDPGNFYWTTNNDVQNHNLGNAQGIQTRLYVPSGPITETGALHWITLTVIDSDGNPGHDSLLVRLHLLI